MKKRKYEVLLSKILSRFYKEYRKDPAKEFRQRVLSGDVYYESEEKRQEHMKLIESLRKERVKKDNNIIELDLLK